MQPAGIYVSTSRKPSVRTRKLARWLVLAFGGVSENRGKRSVREMVQRAAANGLNKLVLVYEDHGNPRQLWILDESDWLACVKINVAADENTPRGTRVLNRVMDSSGRIGGKIAELLAADEQTAEDGPARKQLKISITDSKISFSIDGSHVGPAIGVEGLDLVEPGEKGATDG